MYLGYTHTRTQTAPTCCTFVFTVYVFDHVDTEAMSGDGGEHLPSAPPPGEVVGGAPGGDGTEKQLEVVLLGQLLGRRHKGAELHQNLQEWRGQKTDSSLKMS